MSYKIYRTDLRQEMYRDLLEQIAVPAYRWPVVKARNAVPPAGPVPALDETFILEGSLRLELWCANWAEKHGIMEGASSVRHQIQQAFADLSRSVDPDYPFAPEYPMGEGDWAFSVWSNKIAAKEAGFLRNLDILKVRSESGD